MCLSLKPWLFISLKTVAPLFLLPYILVHSIQGGGADLGACLVQFYSLTIVWLRRSETNLI
jgi:hypothetical protein